MNLEQLRKAYSSALSAFNSLLLGFVLESRERLPGWRTIHRLSIPCYWDLSLNLRERKKEPHVQSPLSIPCYWDLSLNPNLCLKLLRRRLNLSIPCYWDLSLNHGRKNRMYKVLELPFNSLLLGFVLESIGSFIAEATRKALAFNSLLLGFVLESNTRDPYVQYTHSDFQFPVIGICP